MENNIVNLLEGERWMALLFAYRLFSCWCLAQMLWPLMENMNIELAVVRLLVLLVELQIAVLEGVEKKRLQWR